MPAPGDPPKAEAGDAGAPPRGFERVGIVGVLHTGEGVVGVERKTTDRPTDSEPTLLEDIPRAMECTPSPALVYQTSFFDPQFGSLEDVVAAHCFAGAVQTAIGRLPEGIDCTVDATWSHGRGRLEVQTLEGIVIASVQAAPSPVLAIHPSIASACQALQSGETVLSQAQFAQALMQRAAL